MAEQAADLPQRHLVIHRQRDDQGPHPRPILPAGRPFRGILAPLNLPTAFDLPQTMRGHLQAGLRQIKNLPLARHFMGFVRRDRSSTNGATLRPVKPNVVRLLYRAQGLAFGPRRSSHDFSQCLPRLNDSP